VCSYGLHVSVELSGMVWYKLNGKRRESKRLCDLSIHLLACTGIAL
jgi:hypothetical protein